jgi:sec-independent protein translocase protein TatB
VEAETHAAATEPLAVTAEVQPVAVPHPDAAPAAVDELKDVKAS